MILGKISKISTTIQYQKGYATVIREKTLRSIGTVGTVQYMSLRIIIKLQDTFIQCFGSALDPTLLVTADPDQDPGF
jgi:hypothetical protein